MAISTDPDKILRLHQNLSAIGSQLKHYLDHVSAGTADGNLHFVVYQQQLTPWLAMIAGILADSATLASLTAMYPYWTSAELTLTQTALVDIQTGLTPHLSPFNHSGAWCMQGVRALTLSSGDAAALVTLLQANLS